MKTFRLLGFFPVVLSCVLLSCQPQPQATNVEEIKKAIQDADARQVAAFASKNVDAMVANYAPDAVILAPNAPMVSGRDNIRSFFQEMSGMMDSFTFGLTQFDASGDLAYEIGTYAGSFGGVADKGKYATVWKKQADGKWMIVVDIFNTDLPAPAPPPAEPAKKGK